jgi:hypothetical protein
MCRRRRAMKKKEGCKNVEERKENKDKRKGGIIRS